MYLAGLVAIVATVLLVINFKQSRRRQDYVHPERAALHYSPVQIICGDCAGDGLSPLKTFMDRAGRCERCGGVSYVLAAERGMMLRRAMAQRGLYVVASEAAETVRAEAALTEAESAVPLKLAV
jgi:hypothetical protein